MGSEFWVIFQVHYMKSALIPLIASIVCAVCYGIILRTIKNNALKMWVIRELFHEKTAKVHTADFRLKELIFKRVNEFE